MMDYCLWFITCQLVAHAHTNNLLSCYLPSRCAHRNCQMRISVGEMRLPLQPTLVWVIFHICDENQSRSHYSASSVTAQDCHWGPVTTILWQICTVYKSKFTVTLLRFNSFNEIITFIHTFSLQSFSKLPSHWVGVGNYWLRYVFGDNWSVVAKG